MLLQEEGGSEEEVKREGQKRGTAWGSGAGQGPEGASSQVHPAHRVQPPWGQGCARGPWALPTPLLTSPRPFSQTPRDL